MHVYPNGNRRPIAHASQTRNEHDSVFSYDIRFVPSKRNAVADALSRLPLPSAFNEEDAIYRVEERLVHSLPITHKEIRDATQVDTTIQSVRVCQTRMSTTCGGSSPTTLFQPPIWVIGRVRLSSVGATSNQPYLVLGRMVGRVAHRSPRYCADEGNGSYLLMVAEHWSENWISCVKLENHLQWFF